MALYANGRENGGNRNNNNKMANDIILKIAFTIIFGYLLVIVEGAFDRNIGDSCVMDGVNGTCQKYESCASALLVDKERRKFPDICAFEDKEAIVCCTDCYIYKNASEAVITENGVFLGSGGKSVAWDKCLEYVASLPYACKAYHISSPYKRLDEKRHCHYIDILRYPALVGNPARRGDYPHMALLGYGEELESAEWLCGGSIISDRYILTAGHCHASPTFGKVSYVAVGILKRSDPRDLWQVLQVDAFLFAPQYKPPSKYNDIALIRTDKPLVFGPAVLPICLVVEDVPAEEAVIVGWGAQGHRQPVADNLQMAKLVKFNESECAALYPAHRHLAAGVHSPTQVCYGHREKNYDTCEGDSGGPLQTAKPLYGLTCAPQQIGVTSYGRPCGFKNSAGIYTLIKPYLKWIESVVWP